MTTNTAIAAAAINQDDSDLPLLKIGFIGTGGTGKTSLAEALKGLIPETFQESIVRDTMASLHVTDASQATMTAAEKWKVQQALLDAKFYQDDTYTVGLFDRTPIDHMAYTMYRCADVISDEVFHELAARVQEYSDRYDFIAYFPIYDWKVEDDGFRQQNLAYRVAHDLILQGLMAKFEIEFIEMPDAPIEDRVELLLSLLEDERDAVLENEDDVGNDDDEDSDPDQDNASAGELRN